MAALSLPTPTTNVAPALPSGTSPQSQRSHHFHHSFSRRTFFDAAPEGSRMLNLYGSTEIAADVTCMEITEKDVIEGRLDRMGPIVPIGYPISNTVSSFVYQFFLVFSIFWI